MEKIGFLKIQIYRICEEKRFFWGAQGNLAERTNLMNFYP